MRKIRIAAGLVFAAGLLLVTTAAHLERPSHVPGVESRAGTVGDTLVPVFAVRTDTIVTVGRYVDSTGGHAFVLEKHCGITMLFAGWAIRKNGVTSAPIVRDSVTWSVGSATATLRGVNGDTTVDLSKLPSCSQPASSP